MSRTDTAMANAFVPGRAALDEDQTRLVEARARLLGPAYRLMYDSPVQFVRGEGVWLFDRKGERYLDAYNNVASLGHCHPSVVDAVATQAATLATNTRYLHETIVALAEALLATLPDPSLQAMFTCTGSEANDLAWRIAQVSTGGTGVIVTETAYHGITDAVSRFSPSLGTAVELGAHVATVPRPGADGGDFVAAVEAALARLRRHGVRPAMLIVDSMFTSDGVHPDPAGVLEAAASAVRKTGGLFVADEVQSGFARTGTHFWGFERHRVAPDIVTMGKPMGNGHPVAGLAVRPEVVEAFGRRSRYFNTFGGNAVSCAAALAVLRTIEADGLRENALVMGARLKDRIAALARHHPAVRQVRGAGLLLGVEIAVEGKPLPGLASAIVNGMRDERVLISSCGTDHNVLKIRPPLVVTAGQIDTIADTLASVLERVGRRPLP